MVRSGARVINKKSDLQQKLVYLKDLADKNKTEELFSVFEQEVHLQVSECGYTAGTYSGTRCTIKMSPHSDSSCRPSRKSRSTELTRRWCTTCRRSICCRWVPQAAANRTKDRISDQCAFVCLPYSAREVCALRASVHLCMVACASARGKVHIHAAWKKMVPNGLTSSCMLHVLCQLVVCCIR